MSIKRNAAFVVNAAFTNPVRGTPPRKITRQPALTSGNRQMTHEKSFPRPAQSGAAKADPQTAETTPQSELQFLASERPQMREQIDPALATSPLLRRRKDEEHEKHLHVEAQDREHSRVLRALTDRRGASNRTLEQSHTSRIVDLMLRLPNELKTLAKPLRAVRRILSKIRGHEIEDIRHEVAVRKTALQHAIELLPLEPELLTAVRRLEAGNMPIVDAVRRDPVGRAWRKLHERLSGSYRYVILVPWITHGGADLVALHVARLASETHSADEVLLVITETIETTANDWLPPSLHTLVLSEIDPGLTLDERVELLQLLVRSLKPKALLNINSHAGWELYEQYGHPLSTFTDLFAALFCPDYDEDGRPIGYAHRYFRSTLPFLSAIYFDNQRFAEDLWLFYKPAQRFRDRLRTIYQPVELRGRCGRTTFSEALHCLWAGRLSTQKNLQTLLAIAKADATLNIDVYGRGDVVHTQMLLNAQLRITNLHFHGSYSDFCALPLDRFGAYIYTTLWDGLPNALLAAAAAGIPIVAPAVGGIGELVCEQTGWLVSDPMDASAYIEALREIKAHPDEAARRAANMMSLIATRHAWPAYVTAMNISPSFVD